jgi:hypothetical protein
MNEQELIELRKRNEERAKQTIANMGSKWLLHKDNAMTKSKYRKILRTSKKAQLNA